MAEELSPESKLYVKEEIEKVRKENKEEVEKVKSKTTKIFTTVVIIVGLLTGVGVYGSARATIGTAIGTTIDAKIKDVLGNETIDAKIDAKIKAELGNETIDAKIKTALGEDTEKKINKHKKMAVVYMEEAENTRDNIAKIKGEIVEAKTKIDDIKTKAENNLPVLLNMTINNQDQAAKNLSILLNMHPFNQSNNPNNGYLWVGDIALIWGTKSSNKQIQTFNIGYDHFPNKCFTVLTSLPGLVEITKDNENFKLTRLSGYGTSTIKFTYLAIGY